MTDPSTPSSKPSSGNRRQFVLIGLLILLVIGLIYDYKVARPGVDQAYDKIVEKSVLVNSRSTDVFTNKDVQELLNKTPSRTFSEANGDLVEVYSWRSGLPIRTHDLFAVYKKNGENWLFHRHAKYEHEESTEVSKYDGKDRMIVQLDGESPPDPQADSARDGSGSGETTAPGGGGPGGGRPGAGGPGGGGPGGGGPGGGGNFDPEAMFNENDADGDGFLAGDEIMERARENLSEIDTDGDEKISKEEWTARMEAMRARFGGGAGGPGGGEGGRPRGAGSRPELEAEEAPAATENAPAEEAAAEEPAAEEPAAEEPAAEEPAAEEPAAAPQE